MVTDCQCAQKHHCSTKQDNKTVTDTGTNLIVNRGENYIIVSHMKDVTKKKSNKRKSNKKYTQ